MTERRDDVWAAGERYEPYVGRWSRLVAKEFLHWLSVPARRDWVDIGCGTGALTRTILEHGAPRSVVGVDPSPGFVEFARAQVRGDGVRFETGDARSLPLGADVADAAVAGLVLNFVPTPAQALAEMARVVRTGGSVAAYVWDYAGKMELMRRFWDAAVALDPAASELDEGRRFPLCQPGQLEELFRAAGLCEVAVESFDVPTVFRDFDDYWTPFLGGQGPAPGYALALDDRRRAELRDRIRGALPIAADGSISLIARAWAVRGVVG